MTNGPGKSDSSTVPAKSPNQAEGRVAEAAEGRGLAKGNSPERNALRTPGRESTLSALEYSVHNQS
jgi:RNA-directed DNA polymerase